MNNITNKSIEREIKALKMVYKVDDYTFTEIAGKLEFDAGYNKEDAERLAIQCIRSIKRT